MLWSCLIVCTAMYIQPYLVNIYILYTIQSAPVCSRTVPIVPNYLIRISLRNHVYLVHASSSFFLSHVSTDWGMITFIYNLSSLLTIPVVTRLIPLSLGYEPRALSVTHLVQLLGAPLTIHPSSHQLDIGSPCWFGCLGQTSNHPVEHFRTCMAGPGRIPSFGLSDAA